MNRGTEMEYKVITRTVHPQFKTIGKHDIRDLALLKVDKQNNFNRHIKPICLPNKGTRTSFDGKLAEVSGLGTTKFTKNGDGRAPDILLKTNVRVLTGKQCLKTKVKKFFVKDVDSMICAYGLHKDACQIRRLFKKKEFSKRKHSHCYCGESNPLGTRIIGGKQTKPDQIPWQALIYVKNDLSCGGSVISDRYILTAGHCCFGKGMILLQISSLSVYLGVYNREKMNRGTEMEYKVIKIIVHPQFKSHDEHDIRDLALLKVDKQIKFNEHIKPICLPNKGTRTSFDGKLAEVSGWGTTVYSEHGGTGVGILLKTNVRVLTDKQCLKSVVGKHVTEDVESMFCAYGLYKDGCQGDSGGPLTVRSSKGVVTQIGIISWGLQCGLKDHPAVYTRVSTFHDWIRKNIKDSTYCRPKK